MSASERLRRSLAASARDAADAPPPPASVTTLRREIAARGLDDSECVEKADLEAVLRHNDPGLLPVRELKRLIELHGGTVPDAVEKAEFATALRETLKNCPICLDEIGEASDDGWPAAVRCGACRGTFHRACASQHCLASADSGRLPPRCPTCPEAWPARTVKAALAGGVEEFPHLEEVINNIDSVAQRLWTAPQRFGGHHWEVRSVFRRLRN